MGSLVSEGDGQPARHDSVGVDLGQLLLQALDYIFGVAYPLTVSERHNDQQLARKALHGGIIKRAFTGQCWLMACLLF